MPDQTHGEARQLGLFGLGEQALPVITGAGIGDTGRRWYPAGLGVLSGHRYCHPRHEGPLGAGDGETWPSTVGPGWRGRAWRQDGESRTSDVYDLEAEAQAWVERRVRRAR